MRSNPFSIDSEDNLSRTGKFQTAHGEFETPNFMPVGTRGSVKGVDCERLKEVGAQIMLVNTYHLLIRPGPERVDRLGGIHKFSNWSGPILSDSGGFQVFSLSEMRTMKEEGVEFRSHLDGQKIFLSPEKSIEVQETLGVDIAMALDECPSGDTSFADAERSLELTIRWAKRSLAARKKEQTAIFGITQGVCFRELRTRAAEELAQIPFDGMAIGGLSVGEPKEKMYEVLDYHVQQLPGEKIRYLMGVGTPEDIVEAVKHGVDLFDCVMPTRSGRFARAFVRAEEPYLNVKNSRFSEVSDPIDSSCSCLACRNYSLAYIHHLFKVGEMLGPQLLSIHNLKHYLDLMAELRSSIKDNTFDAVYKRIKSQWQDVAIGR